MQILQSSCRKYCRLVSFFLIGFASSDSLLLPYPHSISPLESGDVLFAVASDDLSCFSDIVTVETLSGVLARSKPQVYTVEHDTDPTSGDESFWLSQLVAQTGIVVDETYLNDIKGLLTHFASNLDGYILYSNMNESNAALTLASSSQGSVIVASDACDDTASLLDSLGVPNLGSVSELGLPNDSSLISERMVAFAPNDGSKASCLSGYALFARMAVTEFSYDSDEVVSEWGKSLSHLNPDTLNAAMGWFTGGDEYGYVSAVAVQGSAYAHASDWSTNLDSLSNIKTLSNLHTHSSISSSLVHRMLQSHVKSRSLVKDASMKHTVSFVMSDGDNVCWLQGGWRSETWFGAPERQTTNSVPMGWTFAPAGAELIPTVLSFAQSNSTVNDTLIAGPSGAGYTYPHLFYQGESSSTESNRSYAYAKATSDLMSSCSMSVATVIDGSPSVEAVEPLLTQDNIDAVILLTYNDGYSGLRGNVAYVQDKLVIGGRVSLWDEATSGDMVGVSGLVSTLETLPKDSTDPNSYSLIPVHAWSHNYSDVVQAVRQLEALGGYDILGPDAFVAKLVSETDGKESCPLASGPWGNSCVDCILSGNGTCVLSCSCSPSIDITVSSSCDLTICHENLYIDTEGRFRCENGNACLQE